MATGAANASLASISLNTTLGNANLHFEAVSDQTCMEAKAPSLHKGSKLKDKDWLSPEAKATAIGFLELACRTKRCTKTVCLLVSTCAGSTNFLFSGRAFTTKQNTNRFVSSASGGGGEHDHDRHARD